jgi:hypothetical protein
MCPVQLPIQQLHDLPQFPGWSHQMQPRLFITCSLCVSFSYMRTRDGGGGEREAGREGAEPQPSKAEFGKQVDALVQQRTSPAWNSWCRVVVHGAHCCWKESVRTGLCPPPSPLSSPSPPCVEDGNPFGSLEPQNPLGERCVVQHDRTVSTSMPTTSGNSSSTYGQDPTKIEICEPIPHHDTQ